MRVKNIDISFIIRPVISKKLGMDLLSVVISAVLLIVIFPGFGLSWLAWFALVPLFLMIKRSDPLRSFLASLGFGSIFGCGLVWWMLKLPGVNPLNFYLLVLAIGAIYFAVFGLLACYFQKWVPRWNVFTLPAIWVILEYLRSHAGFLSHPWGILGYSQYKVLPMARISSITGVYGLSFLIVAVNVVLAEILSYYLSSKRGIKTVVKGYRSKKAIRFGIFCGVMILFLAIFFASYSSLNDIKDTPNLKVALVHGNVTLSEGNYGRNILKAFRKFQGLSVKAAESNPDLIVWPESSVPGRLPYDSLLVKMLSNLAEETKAYLLVGTSGYDKFDKERRKKKKVANSAFLFSPQGKIVGRYDKMRLLPFMEYLPLRNYVDWPSWIVNSNMTDFLPGKGITIFDMGKARFGVTICWENMLPGHFRKMSEKGVDFMVSMMNESFTDTPAVHKQILAINVFRAIENNVAIARAALNGLTAIIEPTGRISARVPDESEIDVAAGGFTVNRIQLSSKRTIYNRFGDWFVYVLVVILSGISLAEFYIHKYVTRKIDGYCEPGVDTAIMEEQKVQRF